MANTLRFKRGLVATIPTALAGEPLFTTDTFDLYIGNGTTNTRFQKYIASGTTSQLLRGDGSLLTMPIVLTSPANGQVLKFNGTNWVNESDAGITGSGANTRVAFWTGASTQSSSANFIWDNTNSRLGVGGTFAETTLHVNGSVFIGGSSTIGLQLENALSTAPSSNVRSIIANTSSSIAVAGALFLQPRTSVAAPILFYTEGSERARLHSTGNFGIGTGATDSGQRLQVIGDTLLRGSGATSGSTALTVQNSASAALMSISNDAANTLLNITGSTNAFFRANQTTANRFVQYGSNATTADFYVGSAITAYSFLNNGGYSLMKINTAAFPTAGGNLVEIPAISTAFSPTSGSADFTALIMRPVINQVGATGITRGLYLQPTLTAAADWRSIEWSNNTGWGLRGEGTAPNLLNGSLGIGINSLTGYNLRVLKNITGSTFGFNVSVAGAVQSDVTNNASYIHAISSTQATTFTLPQIRLFSAEQGTFGAGSTVTDQIGFFAQSSLIGATNNFGFYGNIAAGTNRWNLYMNGTANNYLNGNLQIGSATASAGAEKLQVTGTSRFTDNISLISGGNAVLTLNALSTSTAALIFQRSGTEAGRISFSNSNNMIFSSVGVTERMRITDLGNLHVGTFSSDSGEKLQVTGTAKITGASSFGGNMTLSFGQNATIKMRVQNTTAGTASYSVFEAANNTGAVCQFGKGSTSATPFSILNATDTFIYNETSGDIAILNYFNSGNIKFAAGGSSTEQMRLTTAGNLCIGVNSGGDFLNIAAATTAKAQINLAAGTAPTSPNNGDIWFDGTDLKMRIGGVTKTFTLI
jgi:hypothetical protein